MTKLLITEKLITTKKELSDLSNFSTNIEFIKYEELTSDTTQSLFAKVDISYVYDKFLTIVSCLQVIMILIPMLFFRLKNQILISFQLSLQILK